MPLDLVFNLSSLLHVCVLYYYVMSYAILEYQVCYFSVLDLPTLK